MADQPLSVLIVDDQVENLQTLAALLEGAGYRVRKALGGTIALKTIAIEPPDLILLDVAMEDMDGYAVCRQLKAETRHQDIPVLFLSAASDLACKLRAFEAGGCDYITKPFAAPEVLARLAHQSKILSQQRSLQREIQERQRMGALLATQNTTLTTILSTIPDRIVYFWPDGTILQDSWAIPTLVRGSQPVVDIHPPWPPEAWDLIDRGAADALASQTVITLEYSYPQGDQLLYLEARLAACGTQEVLAIIRDVTHQRHLELQAARQLGRDRLLASITENIHQSLQVETILEHAVQGARELIQVNRIMVYQFQTDLEGIVVAEAVSRPELSILGRLIPDPCVRTRWDRPYQEGRIRTIEDVERVSLRPCYVAMLRHYGVRAMMAVPILVGGAPPGQSLWGLLIAHHCDGPQEWQPWAVSLMEHLAGQLAVALQRASLYEQMARQAQRESVLNQILDTMRSSLDPGVILQKTVVVVQEVFQASRALVACHNPDRACLEIVTQACDPQTPPHPAFPIPLEQNSYGQAVLASRDPVAVADTGTADLLAPVSPLIAAAQIRAMVAISFADDLTFHGVLWLQQCDRPRHWTIDECLLLREVRDQLAVALRQAELYQQVCVANQALEEMAKVDGLTQVANRRRFDEYLAYLWQQQRRQQQPLSLILCDVDYFKRYNDHAGHLQGDDCLRQVAALLTQTVNRPGDLVARYGGEEFALILPETPSSGAQHMAQRVKQAIAQARIPHPDSPLGPYLTISLGVATVVPQGNALATHLITSADAALYLAKEQGRDRWVLCPSVSQVIHSQTHF